MSRNVFRQDCERYLVQLQRIAGEYVKESPVDPTVHLPDDTMKDALSVVKDATFRVPLKVWQGWCDYRRYTGSGNLVRIWSDSREIARMTMEMLLKDGRIHPARRELVRKKPSRLTITENMVRLQPMRLAQTSIQTWWRSWDACSSGNFHMDKNVLRHSIEVAKLSGIIASELGENAALACRAGFLHAHRESYWPRGWTRWDWYRSWLVRCERPVVRTH